MPTAAGTTYDWQTPGNWSTDPAIPSGVGVTANLTNDILGAQTSSLSGAVILADNLTLNVGGALSISSAINETGGARSLTKTGAGTFNLSAASAHTGTTTISAGTLAFSSSNRIASSSKISIAGGATLAYSAFVAVDWVPITLLSTPPRGDAVALRLSTSFMVSVVPGLPPGGVVRLDVALAGASGTCWNAVAGASGSFDPARTIFSIPPPSCGIPPTCSAGVPPACLELRCGRDAPHSLHGAKMPPKVRPVVGRPPQARTPKPACPL